MKKLGTALVAASGLLVAGTAAAEHPQWTYGQIGYYQADSIGDDQTDGFTLEGSLGFLDVWHAQVSYIDGSLGFGEINNDFDGYQITIGAHPSITQDTQLVLNGIYFDENVDVEDGDDVNRDGFGAGVGFRTMVTDKVEASAIGYWTYESIDEGPLGFCDNDDDNCDATNVSLVLGGRYNWTNNVSTGATLVVGDPQIGGSDNSMNIDVRWTFDGFSL